MRVAVRPCAGLSETDALAPEVGLVGCERALDAGIEPTASGAKVDQSADLGAHLNSLSERDEHLEFPRLPIQPVRRESDDPFHLTGLYRAEERLECFPRLLRIDARAHVVVDVLWAEVRPSTAHHSRHAVIWFSTPTPSRLSSEIRA